MDRGWTWETKNQRTGYQAGLSMKGEGLEICFRERSVMCRNNNKLRYSGRLVRARAQKLAHSSKLVCSSTDFTLCLYFWNRILCLLRFWTWNPSYTRVPVTRQGMISHLRNRLQPRIVR